MATKSDTTLTNNMSTNAHLQANAQFIEDLLVTTGGWVQVTQTGETAPGSLVKSGSANTKSGFRVYRMNDSLQATAPLYMRLDFGTGTSASIFGVWVSLSSSINGSGTPSGTVYWTDVATTQPTLVSAATALTGTVDSRGAAGTGWAVWRLFDNNSSSAVHMQMSIERTKDSSGNDTADGFLWMWSTSTPTWTRMLYIPAGSSPPTAETGMQVLMSTNNPSAVAGNVGIGIPIPMYGYAQQPGLGLITCRASDIAASASVTLTLYGASHTYLFPACTSTQQVQSVDSGSARASCRAGIRYE